MENMSAFRDSGVSLSKRTLSHHAEISGRKVLDDGICLEYDRRINQKNDLGITLEQLRNRSMEQKLKDLEQLDMRSQVLEPKT